MKINMVRKICPFHGTDSDRVYQICLDDACSGVEDLPIAACLVNS